jgi:hypothetical protein
MGDGRDVACALRMHRSALRGSARSRTSLSVPLALFFRLYHRYIEVLGCAALYFSLT